MDVPGIHHSRPHPVDRVQSTLTDIKPTRSHTDPPTSTKPMPSANSSSKRDHANSLRNRVLPGTHQSHIHKPHRSVRHAARDTVQSAIELKPPTSFDNILRRDRKRSPEPSSRNGSGNAAQQVQPAWDMAQAQAEAERKRVKPEDVLRAKKANVKRQTELRCSLAKVEELGMRSTRELDDTYYSILEKAEVMRNTINEMQRLAEESKESREKFEKDAEVLHGDVGKTLEGYVEFKPQQKRVDRLVERLQNAKSSTEVLNERLEAARGRVETYEKRYHQRQALRRKQWGITSGSVVAVIALIIALLIAKNRGRVELQLDDLGRKLVHLGEVVEGAAGSVVAVIRPTHTEDPYLQEMFKEVL
nr:hypothetical protein B0A51_10547 [Rachicladosporium sp. CCFEE 5018]